FICLYIDRNIMGGNKEDILITLVAGTIVFLCLISFIIVFILLHKRRQKRNKIEKREIQMKFQQELLRTQLEIQEQTLKNISQEIHDNIGQGLTLAKLNLSLMNVNEPGSLITKIEDSKKLVAKAINDLRDIAKGLNSDNIIAL